MTSHTRIRLERYRPGIDGSTPWPHTAEGWGGFYCLHHRQLYLLALNY